MGGGVTGPTGRAGCMTLGGATIIGGLAARDPATGRGMGRGMGRGLATGRPGRGIGRGMGRGLGRIIGRGAWGDLPCQYLPAGLGPGAGLGWWYTTLGGGLGALLCTAGCGVGALIGISV